MRKLLILGAGILQIAIIKKAKQMGIYTIVADGDENAKGLVLADKPIVVNIVNPLSVYEVVKDLNIDGVIHPCSEVAMNTMGFLNEKLGLSGINMETAIRATNKEKMRKAFKNYNAPSPISYGANNFNDFLVKLKSIEGKAIVKPSRNSGSRGVSLVGKDDANDILYSCFETAISNSRDKSVVVEEYIDGAEFSVEIVIYNNQINILAVTDKLTTCAPHFVELGHSQPSLFSEEDVAKIKDAAIKGCRALGLNNCAAHAELKLQDGNLYIIEIGARLGGDFISTELVHLSTGIDMVAAAINIALGLEPNLRPKHISQGAAIRYFVPKSGVINDINLSKCDFNNIYEHNIYVNNGDIISDIKSSLDRSGHVIAVGENVNLAIEKANDFLNSITYTIN